MAAVTRDSCLLQRSHARLEMSVPSCSYPSAKPLLRLNRTAQQECHRHLACQRGRPLQAAATDRIADPEYMQEYQALKDNLLSTTRKAGGGLAAYLLFSVGGSAALCALIGSAASNAYLLWLFRDVDSLQGDSRVALREAEKVQGAIPRAVAKLFAAWSHALQPRLLVPFALAAAGAAFNKLSDQPLDLLHQGCLLGGFLTYKVPLILKIADDNTPKLNAGTKSDRKQFEGAIKENLTAAIYPTMTRRLSFGCVQSYKSEEMSRPVVERFDDELDQWGRPKKALAPLPTAALPDNIDTSNIDLESIESVDDVAKLLLKKATPGNSAPAAAAGNNISNNTQQTQGSTKQ